MTFSITRLHHATASALKYQFIGPKNTSNRGNKVGWAVTPIREIKS